MVLISPCENYINVLVFQKIKIQKEEKEEVYFSGKKKINQKKFFILGYLHHIVILNSRVIGVQNL